MEFIIGNQTCACLASTSNVRLQN